jgi:hypothetical protein
VSAAPLGGSDCEEWDSSIAPVLLVAAAVTGDATHDIPVDQGEQVNHAPHVSAIRA